jgi:hypothetical protein
MKKLARIYFYLSGNSSVEQVMQNGIMTFEGTIAEVRNRLEMQRKIAVNKYNVSFTNGSRLEFINSEMSNYYAVYEDDKTANWSWLQK